MIKKIMFSLMLVPALTHAQYVTVGEPITMDFPELTTQQRNEDRLNREQMKTKGYIEKNLAYPKKMLGMRSKVKFSASKDKEDTELRKNVNEIRLAFNYAPKTNNPIGFAPIMLWTNDGWTGIKEFFDAKDIGICSISTVNMKLTHQSVRIPAEIVKHDINNKVTTILIEGSNNTGFNYRIEWYDSIYSKELECANMTYDKEITNKMITLAKELDKKS